MKLLKWFGYMLFDLFPYALFAGTLVLITYGSGGFEPVTHFTGPGSEGLIVFGVFSCMAVAVGVSVLGGVQSLSTTFSFMAGTKWYDVNVSGSSVSVSEHGTNGLAAIVINFFKCILMLPIKLIKWFLICPIMLIFNHKTDRYLGAIEEESLKKYVLSIIIFVIAILLTLPMVISNSVYQKKYDLNSLKIQLIEYEYSNSHNTALHTFRLEIQEPSNQLQEIEGSLVIRLNNEEYTLFANQKGFKDKILFYRNSSRYWGDIQTSSFQPYLDSNKAQLFFIIKTASYEHGSWNKIEKRIQIHYPTQGSEISFEEENAYQSDDNQDLGKEYEKQESMDSSEDDQNLDKDTERQEAVFQSEYDLALSYYTGNDYIKAYQEFQKCNTYKDTPIWISRCQMSMIEVLEPMARDGNYREVCETLVQVGISYDSTNSALYNAYNNKKMVKNNKKRRMKMARLTKEIMKLLLESKLRDHPEDPFRLSLGEIQNASGGVLMPVYSHVRSYMSPKQKKGPFFDACREMQINRLGVYKGDRLLSTTDTIDLCDCDDVYILLRKVVVGESLESEFFKARKPRPQKLAKKSKTPKNNSEKNLIHYNGEYGYTSELRSLMDSGLTVDNNSNKPIIELTQSNVDLMFAPMRQNYIPRAEEKYRAYCENGVFPWSDAEAIADMVKQIASDNHTHTPNREQSFITDFIMDGNNHFRSRVYDGDVNLVEEIIAYVQSRGGRREKSLASKVCKYFNLYQGKTDYYINDLFVRSMMPYYLDYYGIAHSIRAKDLDKMSYRTLFDHLEQIRQHTSLDRNLLDRIIWFGYKSYRAKA